MVPFAFTFAFASEHHHRCCCGCRFVGAAAEGLYHLLYSDWGGGWEGGDGVGLCINCVECGVHGMESQLSHAHLLSPLSLPPPPPHTHTIVLPIAIFSPAGDVTSSLPLHPHGLLCRAYKRV